MKRKLEYSLWLRSTSLVMTAVFFYVQVGYGAIESGSNLWQERKNHANRLTNKDQQDQNLLKAVSSPKVSPPEKTEGLLSQLPSLETNFLNNSFPISQEFGRDFHVVSQSELGVGKLSPSQSKTLGSWLKAIPPTYSVLRELYIPPNWQPSDLMVFHIQDAHENYEAQKNIAKIIESLSNTSIKGVSGNPLPTSNQPKVVVGLEGASGPMNFEPYQTFPDLNITKEIADYFLKESFISGAEYVGMTNIPNTLFWGIETKQPYLDHIKAFKDSVPLQQKAKEIHQLLLSSVTQIKSTTLNPKLKSIDENITGFNRKEIKIGEYIKNLSQVVTGVSKSHSPNIRQFLDALSLEESLDYEKVEEERRYLTRALTDKLPQNELNNLVTAGVSYRLGSITHGSFYQYLKELCKAYGISLNHYPDMDKYIRYVLTSEKINPDMLLTELNELEKRALESNITNKEEKKVVELSKDLALIEKLISFQMSPAEWEEYSKRKEEIERIQYRITELTKKEVGQKEGTLTYIRPFEKFNRAAIQRDGMLVANLLNKVRESKPTPNPIAIMVSGGFHTTGITRLLKEKKTAYVVLAPRIGEIKGSGSEYLELFTRDKTPLEKLFTGERITLKSPLPTAVYQPAEGIPTQTYVVEREFSLFAAGKLTQKVLSQVVGLTGNQQEDIRKSINIWIRKQDKGFFTFKSLVIEKIEEFEKSDGTLEKARITVTLRGRKGQNSTTVALEIVPKKSDTKSGPLLFKRAQAMVGEDTLTLYVPEPSLIRDITYTLQDYVERGFIDLLPEFVGNIVRFPAIAAQWINPKKSGDPLTSLEVGKKRRLEKLARLKGTAGRKSFRFAIGDIDNISKLNDFFGKELIGGLNKSKSENVVFDNQDETLFVKARHAKNKAMRGRVHAYVGGDELIPEVDRGMLSTSVKTLMRFLRKYAKPIYELLSPSLISLYRNITRLSGEDMGYNVRKFRKELEGRYAVFKIRTETLSDEQKEALKTLKGSQMMVQHEDGYNLLIDRGKKRSMKQDVIEREMNALRDKIYPLFPELERTEDNSDESAIRWHIVNITMSVGAVDADQVFEYLTSKTVNKNRPKNIWLDAKTGRINGEWLEDFYVWGLRLAHDKLKDAKENGKNQASVLGADERLLDEDQAEAIRSKLIKEGKTEEVVKVKANVRKPVTWEKVWDQHKKLEMERMGVIKRGIDTLTGAYTEQEFRNQTKGSRRPQLHLFKMSDYGINIIAGNTRAGHNMNDMLDYEAVNEVIQMVFKELNVFLGGHGFTISDDGKVYPIAARAPPDSPLVASDKPIELSWNMNQMLENLADYLNRRFPTELEKYKENEAEKKEKELRALVVNKIISREQANIELNKFKETVSKVKFNPTITIFYVSNHDMSVLRSAKVPVTSRFQVISMMETIDSVYEKMDEGNQSKFKDVLSVTVGNSGRTKGVSFKPENWTDFMNLYRAAQVIKAKEAKIVLFPEKPASRKPKAKSKRERIRPSKPKSLERLAMTLPETRARASEFGLSPYSWATEVLFAPVYEFFGTFNPFKFHRDHKYIGWRGTALAIGIGVVWVSMVGAIVFAGWLLPDIKYLIYLAGTISLISGVHLSRVQDIENKIFNPSRWKELSLTNKAALVFVLPLLIPNATIHSLSNMLFRITRFTGLWRSSLIEKNVELITNEVMTQKKKGVSVPQNLIPQIIRGSLINSVMDYESLERFQVSENYQNLLQSLKLLQAAANLKDQRAFNLPDVSELGDKEKAMLRTLRYMSDAELSQLMDMLERLSRMDQKKMSESFGVWAEKLIEAAAERNLSRDISTTQEQKELQMTSNQMVMAYEGFTALLSPKSKVSDLQREMVKKVWESTIKLSKERAKTAKSDAKDIRSLPIIQEIENHKVTGAIDTSNPNPSEDQILLMAQQIIQAWREKGEGIKGVIVPLITNQDSMNREIIGIVKKTLEQQGHKDIAGEFNKTIHFVVGTRIDLLSLIKERGEEEIDPSLEMDPDDVNEVLLGKIKDKIGKTFETKEISLKLFTDNLHRFKKSWKSKIQIFMILSGLEVVEISKEISDTLQARRVLALQQ